jgi:hypothetical protein
MAANIGDLSKPRPLPKNTTPHLPASAKPHNTSWPRANKPLIRMGKNQIAMCEFFGSKDHVQKLWRVPTVAGKHKQIHLFI